MTNRIVLHVGSPKCGSTYLQQVMRKNRASLSEAGIAYPLEGRSTHPGNAATIGEITEARLTGYFTPGIHTLVFSHEDLYGMPKRGEALAALAPKLGIEVQVIAFLRPFSEFMFGDYSQMMKQNFEDYLAKRQPYGGMTFARLSEGRAKSIAPAIWLNAWQRYFPQTKLILEGHRKIRPVLEQLLGPEAFQTWEIHRDLANPSLRMEDCDRIAEAMLDPAVSAGTIRDMFRTAFHSTELPDAGKSRERIAMVEDLFAPINAALLKNFGFDNRRQ